MNLSLKNLRLDDLTTRSAPSTHVFKKRLSQYKKIALASIIVLHSSISYAHFQEMIPDRDYLNAQQQQPLDFSVRFTHPMSQGPIMPTAKPEQLWVKSDQQKTDLLPLLTESAALVPQWSFQYTATAPGDLIFFIEPAPYWEKDEGKMIIHYTKVIIDSFAGFNGWDQPVNAPVEIIPLTRPYSLWVGNAFQGIVNKAGKAVPFATIEIEWRNDGSITPPTDGYITQVIKADSQGVFSYVMPRAGWWGFAALIDADYQLTSPQGKPVPVELGGLIWINAKKMQ